jgi:hypothetical protein
LGSAVDFIPERHTIVINIKYVGTDSLSTGVSYETFDPFRTKHKKLPQMLGKLYPQTISEV